MKTIKVRINEDGITAKEVNHLGDRPTMFVGNYEAELVSKMHLKDWAQAEAALRTFIIESANGKAYPFRPLDGTGDEYYFEIGSIHTAELLPNRKIKII